MVKAITLCAALALAGCQATGNADVFCQTHRQADFTLSRATIAVMVPDERRNALAILEEGAKLCGWKAGR